MLKVVKLQEQLLKIRNKHLKKKDVLTWVENVFSELDSRREETLQQLLSSENSKTNSFNIDNVDVNAVFHISQIKKVCIDYRLRFLDTIYFKGDYPAEVISKIHQLEKLHNTKIEGFKIVAPSVLFKLKKADDPLLFAPIGNDYYYLIHKWGNDLHPLRKLKYWFVKSLENFAIFLLTISFLLTTVSYSLFSRDFSFINFVVIYLFFLKGAIGFGLFYGISSGKNFSEYSWQSKHDKIC